MKNKISVIVPIFKVEKYLDNCIKSLVNQTYKNLEIILVDDKSPDSCPAICDKWAERDERIKVIHKEINEGLGFARNTGIEAMTGDFVTFVDSDDYLDLSAMETALSKIDEYNADVCFYDCKNIYKDKIYSSKSSASDRLFKDDEIINKLLVGSFAPKEDSIYNEVNLGASACMALYKACYFYENKLRFVSERNYMNEDSIFRIDLCRLIKTAVLIPNQLYYYWHHDGTLSTTYRENRFDDSVSMYLKTEEILNDFNNFELLKRNMRWFMINLITLIKQEVINAEKTGFRVMIKNIRTVCKNKEVQKVLSVYPINKMPIQQKLLFYFIKFKMPLGVTILVKIKFSTSKQKQ